MNGRCAATPPALATTLAQPRRRGYTGRMNELPRDPHAVDGAATATDAGAPLPPPEEHPPTPVPFRVLVAFLAVFVLALAFGGWGLWRVLAGGGDAGRDDPAQVARLAELEQQVATLTRSDQISRDANRDLQGSLAERDEEVAGLRADVAFYERFVGATGQRRGLTVHELKLQPQDGGAWHYTATLTQTLNRGAASRGALTLEVEGSRDGRLQRLTWSDLRQQPEAAPAAYSFKYFQQLEGDILLPPGFTPVRVHVRLQPDSGARVETSFAWGDAATSAGAAAAKAAAGA